MMQRRRIARALFVSTLSLFGAAMAGGCVKTDTIVSVFNGGALDTSNGDPYHDATTRRQELVVNAMRSELEDAFFGQGGSDSYVAKWLDARGNVGRFTSSVASFACSRGVEIGVCARQGATTGTQSRSTLRRNFEAATRSDPAFDPTRSVCGPASSGPPAIEQFSDYVRFNAAMERAARAVAPLRIERLVDDVDIERGAATAFAEAAAYMRDRTWRRQRDRRTTALVVKGGASTGIYSAGVVWTALHLIMRCMDDAECSKKQKDFRFELVSGTSTGALISTAVDFFNSETTGAGRRSRMNDIAKWFTCSSMNDLYCLRSGPVLDLLREQTALLEFDGLTKLLRENVSCKSVGNSSELILNTVDFRTGRLYSLSDQDPATIRSPWDVVQGALASAVLPVIARPVEHLPVDYDAKQALTYLDGGIRSEIPLMPVARRGAERVMVVSSSASVMGESPPLKNALAIAAHYIDISTGGVTESELAHAQHYVESARLAEIDACRDLVAGNPTVCPASSGCDVDALCGGDWDRACGAKPAAAAPNVGDTPPLPPPAPQQVQPPSPPAGASGSPSGAPPKPAASAATSTAAPGSTAGGAPTSPTTDDRLAALWDMRAFFRDEARVDGLHGYDFDPTVQRALFQAGLDAGRVRCMEIAGLLGIPVPRTRPAGEDCSRGPRSLRCRVVDWCSPVLPAAETLCKGSPPPRSAATCSSPTATPTESEQRACVRAASAASPNGAAR